MSKRAERRRIEREAARKAFLSREGKDNIGMDVPRIASQDDIKLPESVTAELGERQEVVESQFKIYQSILPGLLKRLGRIEDIRTPKKVKHQHTIILLYGILMFVFNMTSRREATYKYTQETGRDLIKEEIESHAKTFYKMLEINHNTIRMDSVMINSSCRKLLRLEIVYSCLQKLLNEVTDIDEVSNYYFKWWFDYSPSRTCLRFHLKTGFAVPFMLVSSKRSSFTSAILPIYRFLLALICTEL